MIRLEVRHREQAEKARISHELGMAYERAEDAAASSVFMYCLLSGD